MVSYSKMTDAEIEKYREKSRKEAEKIQPSFICDDLYINFKKRLYAKDPIFYKKWEYLGPTEANYYFVNGQWLRYENGKKEIDIKFGKC